MATNAYETMYGSYADAAADRYNIPRDLFRRLIMSESSFNPKAIGPEIKGQSYRAIGIAQFIPETAKRYGVDPTDPMQSLLGAARYMSDLRARFGGWDKATAAYKGYSNIDAGAKSKSVLGVVGNADYSQQLAYFADTGNQKKNPEKLAVPEGEKSQAGPTGAIWKWTGDDWSLFFRNTAVGAVLFIAGLLLIVFTLYVAVTRGSRAVGRAVPEVKGAFSSGG